MEHKFYERFNELINESEISMYKLREELWLGKNTLTNWKYGRQEPNVTNLVMICKHFNVSVDWLLGLSNERGRK